MELSQGSKSLIDLVKKSFQGEVMLPDFQRNFVWARTDVEELFKSLLENMFIGNFLIHNIDPLNPPFKPIPIEGALNVNDAYKEKPSILILDGQQRLSSIFYGMFSPNIPLKNVRNPYAFFIDIPALLEGDMENSVFSWSKKSREYKAVYDIDKQKYFNEQLVAKEIIPTTFLIGDFTEIWYELYKDKYNKEEGALIRKYINNIINYNVLTLDVPLSEKPENIAVLFERINRTGIKLSIFDLLVARLYKYLNLREKWEELFDNYSIVQHYVSGSRRNTQTPYYFIQALALKSGLSIKAREMLRINEQTINEENWAQLTNTVVHQVLNRLLDINEYGVANPEKWLPYSTMLVPYLAFFLNSKFQIDKIDKWYWASVFNERYASSVESKITKDYKEVINWMQDDSKIPTVIKEINESIQKDNYFLWEVMYNSNSVYKGVFNLLFINQARDFYQNDKIKFAASDLDDHHIFPKKFLENKNVKDYVNSLPNRTLIHSNTNKKISRKSPNKYLTEILEMHNNDKVKVLNIMKSHFIDEEVFDLMMNVKEETPDEEVKNLFEVFLDLREKLIIEAIQEKVKIKTQNNA